MNPDDLLKLLSEHKKVLNGYIENSKSIENEELDRLIEDLSKSVETLNFENISREKIDLLQKSINEIVKTVEKLKEITLSDMSRMKQKTTAGIKYLKNSL
jgi:transcriptional regulator of heat shock response